MTVASKRVRLRQPVFDWRFSLVTIAMVAVILHGSLYPYAFHMQKGTTGAIGTLLGSWAKPPTSFGDLVANILLYMPFGFFGVLALHIHRRLLLVTLLGLALCTAVELAQFYDAGRVTNMSDLYLNTFGTWLGGMLARTLHIRSRLPLLTGLAARPVPLLLLTAMLGYHLFPYVPTIDLHKYWHSLKPLIVCPSLGLLPTLRYFVVWLTIDFLVSDALGRERSRIAIPLFAAVVFAAKILIVNQSLSAPEVMGALLAAGLWLLVLRHTRWRAFVLLAVLGAMVIVLRLVPLEFTHTAVTRFGWLPFRGYLQGSLAVNVQTFFEKTFLYGSVVWIAGRAGLPLWTATLGFAFLILATSIAEMYLPGRSAEITDAIMVVMIGFVFMAMSRESDNMSVPPARRMVRCRKSLQF